ncbi:centrin-1-like [Hydractinia symbiolongicarpus]|uniref:centrin-1-like n=1 Tax=Hydractinia symbiolongicarpus TaxID=13093 RepID=UPI00254B8B74|nr:centrin-1-like [Hydractinia symbiolongicarpus]
MPKKGSTASILKDLKSTIFKVNQICTDMDEPLPPKLNQRAVHDIISKGYMHKNSVAAETADSRDNIDFSFFVKKELTRKDINDLSVIFEIFALKSSAKISFIDLLRSLRFLQFNVNKRKIREVLQNHNLLSENTDSFDLNAFLTCVIELQNQSRDIGEEIYNGFTKFDIENTNVISIQNLKFLNQKHNLDLSESELMEMIEEADADGDGFVDQCEFVNVMRRTNLFRCL